MSGIEWLVEAFGCSQAALQDQATMKRLFDLIVSDMRLKPLGEPVWHQFQETGGITVVWLLQESHLAIHSFPEYLSACLNVFCCKHRPSLNWEGRLPLLLGAAEIQVREYPRVYNRSA